MSENKKISPKLMSTQQTFDTCIFQFRPWLPTEYLVDKWHNQCMDIRWCTNTFVHRLYLAFLFLVFAVFTYVAVVLLVDVVG